MNKYTRITHKDSDGETISEVYEPLSLIHISVALEDILESVDPEESIVMEIFEATDETFAELEGQGF